MAQSCFNVFNVHTEIKLILILASAELPSRLNLLSDCGEATVASKHNILWYWPRPCMYLLRRAHYHPATLCQITALGSRPNPLGLDERELDPHVDMAGEEFSAGRRRKRAARGAHLGFLELATPHESVYIANSHPDPKFPPPPPSSYRLLRG